jgi:hypothetical protein
VQAHPVRVAKIPVRTLPPVLAGIRADKAKRPTFPCRLHSGYEGPLVNAERGDAAFQVTLAYRCGGSTRWLDIKRRVSRLTARMNMRAGTKT